MRLKAGDWVRDTREGMRRPIAQLKENCIALTHPEEHAKHFVLWQPKEGEWCWFWSEGNLSPHIMQFSCMAADGKTCLSGFAGYDYCEPFIGTLPSFINLT